MALPAYDPADHDFTYHVDTYRSFVKYSVLFAAHVVFLAYFFV